MLLWISLDGAYSPHSWRGYFKPSVFSFNSLSLSMSSCLHLHMKEPGKNKLPLLSNPYSWNSLSLPWLLSLERSISPVQRNCLCSRSSTFHSAQQLPLSNTPISHILLNFIFTIYTVFSIFLYKKDQATTKSVSFVSGDSPYVTENPTQTGLKKWNLIREVG